MGALAGAGRGVGMEGWWGQLGKGRFITIDTGTEDCEGGEGLWKERGC